MKKHQENPTRGGQNYVSPELEVIELQIEGSVCNVASLNWNEGEEDWFN